MENNTTKSIDSGNNELSVKYVNDINTHKCAVGMTLFEISPREMDKSLTSDDIMDGLANKKNTKLSYYKSLAFKFKQFVNEILNGITINLRGRLKSKTTTRKAKTDSEKPKSVKKPDVSENDLNK